MAELKTKENDGDVLRFINSVENKQRREDGLELLKIFQEATGLKPRMWGTAIVGFGKYHYKSKRSSQEGDWPLVGFSPRKQNLTLYVMTGTDKESELLERLGKHKTSVGCLYINKLDDVDLDVLQKLVNSAYLHSKKTLVDDKS